MNKVDMSAGILKNELIGISLFSCLPADALEAVSNFSEIWAYAPNEKIIIEGELNKGFYILLSGKLEISKHGKYGDVKISVLKNHASFGETALFKDERATATVTAVEHSIILIISRIQFSSYIDMHPKAGNVILTYVAFSLLQKLKLTSEELAEERDLEFSEEDIKAIRDIFRFETEDRF